MMLFALSSNDLIPYIPDALRVFLAVWLFAVGGCVGSFLNVVVLRIPAGIGIARSGSRCPVCLHPIRWFDNIPMISWLVLRGSCRDCRTPISVRYPLVELLVALIFLTLGLVEGLSGGRNLPWPGEVPLYFRFSPLQYWSLYTFHIVAIVTVLSTALIERDGNEVAPWLFAPALLVGLLASLSLPFLHPVPAVGSTLSSKWLSGLVDGSWGLVAGALMGAAAWPVTQRQPWRPRGGRTAFLASMTVGLFLGWQAVGPVVAVTTVAFLFISVAGCLVTQVHSRLGRGAWCSYLAVSLLVYVMNWRQFVEHFPALGTEGAWWVLCACAVTVLLVSVTTALWFTPAREFVQSVKLEGVAVAALIQTRI